MNKVLLSLIVAVFIGVILFFVFEAKAKRSSKKTTTEKSPLESMRLELFTKPAETFGITLPKEGNGVWGIVMEMGVSEGSSASLISLLDGTTSLYYSNGGGMIGLGSDDQIKSATVKFVKEAESFVDNGTSVEKFPYPKNGEVYFYFLTKTGVKFASAKQDDADESDHVLHKLFISGNKIIEQALLYESKKK